MKAQVQKQKRSRPRKRKSVIRPWLLLFRLMMLGIAAGVLWVGYMLWLINGYSAKESYPPADAGIVLGAALWNDRPSPALKERLDAALALLEDGTVKTLVLSGGHGGRSSTLSEAEGMRNYLLEKGAPEDKLLLETKATSTFQNLVYSRDLAEEQGLRTFLVITHDYHASRAGEIANYAKIETVGVAGVKSRVLNEFYNDSREVLAYTKWKLDWLTMTLGLRSPDSML
ncbi:YdcF family protein [Paenibacillus nanensis]|uniref:YdcF family protein n=1 Tax=Paenibacillus nanensis TaxID=393251 RepID=A0A3A1V2E9_9BACL|nr:YdcF family protein [Paenibacillus nanensis]RIX53592.1 YdcF family protein [Paenibacillus nanensis]